MQPPVSPSRPTPALELLADPTAQVPAGEANWLAGVFRVLRFHPWLILGTAVAVCLLTAGLTYLAVPVYEASTTVRIDEKQSPVPALVGMLAGADLSTEVEELRSRSLAEVVARGLTLQFRLSKPVGVRRDDLFRGIQVDTAAAFSPYELRHEGGGRYTVFQQDSGRVMGAVRLGERVELPGLAFTLDSSARAHSTIEFRVRTLSAATSGLTSALTIRQVNREAKMVEVSYQDSDPDLAWRVPRAIVEEFIARREQVRTAQARNTAAFLRKQLDTLTEQLATSEDALKAYRERHRVVSPGAEATGQVHRLVETQSRRGLVEAERAALAQLLKSIEARAATSNSDEQSPYAELLSFPTLLQSNTANELLKSLREVQEQRRTLQDRRTPEDPDVLVLTKRKAELEQQIRAMATTYLAALSNQVTSLDANLATLNRELARIPETELQVARLERRPRVLDEIVGMLQTRLKEAEIAAAATDPTIRVVDAAFRPERPISPQPVRNMMIAAVGGLLLGIGAAFTRDRLDRSVRSRDEVVLATGLPVLGVIPRIRSSQGNPVIARQRTALESQAQTKRLGTRGNGHSAGSHRQGAQGSEVRRPAARPQVHYTFLDLPPAKRDDTPREAVSSPDVAAKPPQTRTAEPTWELLPNGRAAAEAYNCLQTNVIFARPESSVKVVVFTSPLPGEGKTTTTVNLALALTQRGLRTLLLDADIRRGRVHSFFGEARGPGLTEVLGGELPFERALRAVRVGEGSVLHYLPVGRPVDNPTGLLDGEAMQRLLASARETYDTVIVDSSPINVVTDAALLSLHADGVLIVVRAGVTDRVTLEHALEQLRRVRAPVLGVVLNDVDFAKYGSYDRAYRYYSDHNSYLSTEA